MKRSFAFIVFIVLVVACSTQRKLQSLIKGNAEQVQLKLGEEADFLPKVDTTSRISHDTLKVKDDEGNEMILMNWHLSLLRPDLEMLRNVAARWICHSKL